MHEYPITQHIIEVAEEFAKKNNGTRIRKIDLVVGDYCGYVASSIELYFDLIAQETMAFGAELEIERVIPQLQCTSCKKFFTRKPYSFTCPDCQGEGEPTEIGKEFYIRSIEIEKESENEV